MVSDSMLKLGTARSVIRELFEYGLKRKAEIGADNVFDFSLGNPSVPAPDCVKEALSELVNNTDPVALHGYTSAQGAPDVRKACADYVNQTHYPQPVPYEKTEPNQLIVDYIASMTDDYLIDLHHYLFPDSGYDIEYTGYFTDLAGEQ